MPQKNRPFRSLSTSYQKKGSFFWYDTNYRFIICSPHRLHFIVSAFFWYDNQKDLKVCFPVAHLRHAYKAKPPRSHHKSWLIWLRFSFDLTRKVSLNYAGGICFIKENDIWSIVVNCQRSPLDTRINLEAGCCRCVFVSKEMHFHCNLKMAFLH